MSIKIIKTIISVLDVLLLTIFGALAWGAHAVGSLLPSAKVAAGIYLVTELTFFVYEKLRHKKLNDAFLRPPDPVRAAVAMKRFCDLKDVFGLEDFLEGWFFGTPAKSIPRGNIEEFVAFAFYQLKPENLSQEQHKDVDDLLERIQKCWGVSFSSGYDPSLKFMAHLWEPLRAHHKPLIAYIISEVAAVLSFVLFRLMGFKKAKDGSLTTWTLQRKQFNNTTTAAAPAGPMEQAIHTVGGQVLDAAVTATGTAAAAAAAASSLQYTQNTSKSTAQPSMVVGPQQQQQQQQHRNHDQTTQPHFIPIVLIPGLGLGVLPFLLFVRDIMKKCPNNPLILMEMPHVSLRVCRCAVEFDVVAQAAVDAVRRIGADRACFIGQSYGSFCTSRILQLFPEVVQSVVLLDPVCILTCYPRLLYNFIYRRLNITESLSVFIFDAIRYLFARDLTVSETFCRKFHWSELQIWPEDLPETSLICLSGKDTLLPATAARKQFEGRPGVTIMYHPDLGHGQMLLRTNWMSQIADRVTKMIMQQQQQQ